MVICLILCTVFTKYTMQLLASIVKYTSEGHIFKTNIQKSESLDITDLNLKYIYRTLKQNTNAEKFQI